MKYSQTQLITDLEKQWTCIVTQQHELKIPDGDGVQLGGALFVEYEAQYTPDCQQHLGFPADNRRRAWYGEQKETGHGDEGAQNRH